MPLPLGRERFSRRHSTYSTSEVDFSIRSRQAFANFSAFVLPPCLLSAKDLNIFSPRRVRLTLQPAASFGLFSRRRMFGRVVRAAFARARGLRAGGRFFEARADRVVIVAAEKVSQTLT